ncbi:MAG: phBC6A51 family helix-turn-helix protein [Ruminiclostridium sp.]
MKSKKVRKSKEWKPHAKQVKMAELLLNPEDRRTKFDKCKEVGVTQKTLWQWMKDNRFVDYLNGQLEQYTNGELAGVWRALINQCMRGNVSAMKLFFELKEMHPEIKIKRESLEIAKAKANLDDNGPTEDDGFIEALTGKVDEIWQDE